MGCAVMAHVRQPACVHKAAVGHANFTGAGRHSGGKAALAAAETLGDHNGDIVGGLDNERADRLLDRD